MEGTLANSDFQEDERDGEDAADTDSSPSLRWGKALQAGPWAGPASRTEGMPGSRFLPYAPRAALGKAGIQIERSTVQGGSAGGPRTWGWYRPMSVRSW